MMFFDLKVKNGTAGYFDPDGSDYTLINGIKSLELPRIGEKISFHKGGVKRTFLVTDVNYFCVIATHEMQTIIVYCIPADGEPIE